MIKRFIECAPQHKGDDDDDDVKEYTTMEVSGAGGAPIHLHVVDEDNRTIQVLNVDNQGYVTNFSWGNSDVNSKNIRQTEKSHFV